MLLDEPVNGLDPEGVHWIRNLMRSLAAEGRTVLLSSHLISEMALTADQLVVIGSGRLLDPEVVTQLAGAGGRADDLASLTDRERQVLSLMAEGRPNAGIAQALVGSAGTVEEHVAGIFGKLGLPVSEDDNRRVLAVLRFLRS